MMGYWNKLLPSHVWYQKKRTHVLFDMVKSRLRSSLRKKVIVSLAKDPFSVFFGTGVTVAPLSGYSCLVQGRRKRRRPKRRWLDKVKDDIKEKGMSADDVYDRATWRRMSSYIDPT